MIRLSRVSYTGIFRLPYPPKMKYTQKQLSLVKRRKIHLMELGSSLAPLLRGHTVSGLRFSEGPALHREEDGASILDFFETLIPHNAYRTQKMFVQTKFESRPGI